MSYWRHVWVEYGKACKFSRNLSCLVVLFLKYCSVNPYIIIYSDEDNLQLICTILVTEGVTGILPEQYFPFLFSCQSLRTVQYAPPAIQSHKPTLSFLWNTSGSSEIPPEWRFYSILSNLPKLSWLKHGASNTEVPG